jgi:hypothetical protein
MVVHHRVQRKEPNSKKQPNQDNNGPRDSHEPFFGATKPDAKRANTDDAQRGIDIENQELRVMFVKIDVNVGKGGDN